MSYNLMLHTGGVR